MKTLLVISGAIFVGSLSSCGSGGSKSEKDSTSVTDAITRTDTTAPATDSMNKKVDTVASTASLSKESLTFLSNVANVSQLEVKLGELAQQNAKNQRVKDFGSMMVKDHNQARQEVKNLVQGSNLMINDSLPMNAKKEYAMMESKKGAAFDKAYSAMMVKGHTAVIKDFEKARSLPEPSVKSFVDKTLPVIKTHLDSAQALTKLK